MSKKSLNPKTFPAWMAHGESPAVHVRGILRAAEAIKNKFRSPFSFCRPRKTAPEFLSSK
mgnify:CR=1 FL=1